MAETFDVIVIGGGPGGYVAAIRCGQLGLKTACVERWRNAGGDARLGGTCLHVGCIPSKALLESSEHYHQAVHGLADHGVRVEGVAFDLAAMMARKEKIIAQLAAGIEMLFRKNKVTWLKGSGRFLSSDPAGWRIGVDGEEHRARSVIIATGSSARRLSGIPVDNRLICDNAGALSFDSVPKRLGVIGAGVIGLELGSVWRRLGTEVTLLEGLPTFLPGADETIAKEAWKLFTRRQGLDIRLGVAVKGAAVGEEGVQVAYEEKGEARTLACDRLIVAVGRDPHSEGLGVEAVGLQLDARGAVEVDRHCRTNLPDVYAIGDVVRGPMLAHKAMEEGVMVAERIAGEAAEVNLDHVPMVMYTEPEIAWVGRSEQQLKAEGVAYRAGQIPFLANGRALGQGNTAGLVKMLADAHSDRLLGVHLIGAGVSELVAEAVVAMEFGASADDLARVVHAHPTRSEALHEAALAVNKRAVHF